MSNDQSPEALARLAQQRLRKKQRRNVHTKKNESIPTLSKTQYQGSLYENEASIYLQRQGLIILEQNLKGPMGEIDIVARTATSLVFVEVRYRKTKKYGGALNSISPVKQQRIIRTAHFYFAALCHHYFPTHTPYYRFDVVAFEGQSIHWIQNAFS